MPVDDSYYSRPPGVRTRIGAGGVVARRDPDSGAILVALIRGPDHYEYVLPKGGVDPGETIQDAAVREIEEEAGFTDLKCLGELGVAQRLNGKRTTWQTTHYFVFLTKQVSTRPKEHTSWEVAWFGLNALPDMRWREQRELIEKNRRTIERLVGGG